MTKSLLVLSLSLVLGACSNTPLSVDTTQQTKDGLSKVENGKMNMAYVKAGMDWSRFTKIYFAPVTVTNDHPEGYKAPRIDTRADGLNATYDLDDKTLQELATAFNTVAKDVFDGEQPYQLVNSVDENTLIVEVAITDIRLSAPVESSRRSFQTAGGATYTQNSGSMMLLAQVKDGKDNTVIAKAADRGQTMDQWQQNTKVFNMGDVKTIYRSWINGFKNALMQTHAANK
ncbi:DUF3313 domain-containing protein [Pseudoalteromonas shioyasakiensis]|uniref:DUF3313 family protein n=1 Tax=Pseudoalteromonas shioyasakiensis TaxID=1190813 RepID=UPI002117F8FC|nr:DUF3313 family protein [Pseudoalteromonas shioyasakiensis]MCQ8878246.1 DUF3313 domain-containing protein [Pseudoalteromonas shioyasakiensis]